MNFFGKLKDRWNVKTTGDALIILLVFSFTGITSLFIKKPLFRVLGIKKIEPLWLNIVVYIVCVLVFYNILLLIYGFIFGKFRFFFNFEKQFLNKILNIFKKKIK